MIKATIKVPRRYKVEEFVKDRILVLIDRLIKYGEDYAINEVGHIDTGATLNSIVGYREGNTGVIVAGENAVWIEFGTGTLNNGTGVNHPASEGLSPLVYEHGMYGGTVSKGYESSWVYYDDDGFHYTEGMPANPFMYRTMQELKRVFPEKVKEVFND